MLAVQTAEENLFVPDEDIASLTPVYPNRTRVVLADGTVAHRPGPPPPGPWVPLHDSWVNPRHLTRQGDYWKDPADYLYPYQPVAEMEVEQEETELPDGLIAFEIHNGAYYWRTDTGLEACDLKHDQAQHLYPQLCLIGKSHLINMRRVRRYGLTYQTKRGWFLLDNGERIEFASPRLPSAYQALGVESMVAIEKSQPPVLNKLRDFPYDLTTGDPERIRQDCPTPELLLYNVLWQAVLQNRQGAVNDYGRDTGTFLVHPVGTAASRCGYDIRRKDLTSAYSRLVHHEGLIHLSQLGFLESGPLRRFVGKDRPEALLITSHSVAEKAVAAAQKLGVSLLLSKFEEDRLPLEKLMAELPGALQIFFHQIEERNQKTLLRILEHLDAGFLGPPIQLADLSDLRESLENLPTPYVAPSPEPFVRIPLQAKETGLLLADPEEIAAWSPTRFSRWRVVLVDGQVLHHPGPVPSGPWVQLGEHWVQPHLLQDGTDPAGFKLSDLPVPSSAPASSRPRIQSGPALPCPAERVLFLENSAEGADWVLDDGSRVPAEMSAELAAPHHPGLLRLSKTCWVHHNRIRLTGKTAIQMDGQIELRVTPSQYTHKLRQALNIPGLDRLSADDRNLDFMGVRDFPFEIVRAPAAVLRLYFPTAYILICNLLYQSFDMYQKTGKLPYGDTFSGYYYRPLQATLYRAGFLTRAQFRFLQRDLSAKDRHYYIFTRAIYAMVYNHKLFTYRQFGFKDPYPEDRIIGKTRPHQILLVEKGDQIEAYGRRLQEQFGTTLLVLKGNPSLLATEYFAEELKKLGITEVEVYFYGDYDYAGWDIGLAFLRQLKFYGIRSIRFDRLVLPECFTKEELALFSRPIEIPTPTIAGRVRRWLKESGGIDGEARGIHGNWLFPYERLQSRVTVLIR